MSNIIDITQFKGALSIPNIEKDTEAFEDNYIGVYEPQILKRLLGIDLYNQFKTGLSDDPIEDKWKNLRDGITYEVEVDDVTYTIEWTGVDKLIAYYVYYWYVKENYQQLTGLGVINSNAENATKVDPNTKLVWAWNECKKLSGLYDEITTGEDLTYESIEDSLFNFIINNIDDYTNWVYNPIQLTNILGI